MSPDNATRIWVLGEGREADRHAAAWTALGDSVELHRLPVSVAEEELTESERPAAASVCLPAEERLAQCRTLLAVGVHVLCAPPVSDTPEDTAALVAAAHESRAAFVPAHPLLYAPGMTRVTAYVFARRLGSVQNVFSYRYGPTDVRLLYEPAPFESDWELSSQAALIKMLCLMPEARSTDLLLREQPGEFWLAGRMYYDDDILATVRCDPEVDPPRRGVMITFSEAVLQWELTAGEETLTLLRGPHRRDLPLEGRPPYEAMAARFLRTVTGEAPAYENEAAALRALALERLWRA